MALPTSTVATDNISSLENLPNDTGDSPLTPAQLKAAFDKFAVEWTAFYNTHVVANAATLDDLAAVVTGDIPDGSLSLAKLDTDVATQTELNAVNSDLGGTGRTTETIKGAYDLINLAVPTGTPLMWTTSTPPTGYLKRNGAAISRTTYAALFAVISTIYGAGDGSTTFNLPDDRGLVERGWDDGKGYDTGRVFGSYQADDNKLHGHTFTGTAVPPHTHEYYQYNGTSVGSVYPQRNSADNPTVNATFTTGASGGHTPAGTISNTGSTEVTMKNRAYLPIIKY